MRSSSTPTAEPGAGGSRIRAPAPCEAGAPRLGRRFLAGRVASKQHRCACDGNWQTSPAQTRRLGGSTPPTRTPSDESGTPICRGRPTRPISNQGLDMTTQLGQTGRRRGPYKGRQKAYADAIRLRKQGYGYRSIATKIGVPWKTVLGWVKHIAVDPRTAHTLAMSERRATEVVELRGKPAIKRLLIDLRGHRCEGCKRRSWRGEAIPLEVHRKTRGGSYQDEDDLELLCPNCHSQTPTWKCRRPD